MTSDPGTTVKLLVAHLEAVLFSSGVNHAPQIAEAVDALIRERIHKTLFEASLSMTNGEQ
jgi:hypothetical protein